MQSLDQLAVELGRKLIEVGFDIVRWSGCHGPPEDGVEQVATDRIVGLLGQPQPANFGGRFEVTGGAENGKGIPCNDVEVLAVLACNLVVVLKGFPNATFDHGLERHGPRPLLPGGRIERQCQPDGLVECARATREIGCDERQVAESVMSQAVDGIELDGRLHSGQGLFVELSPEQQQAKPQMGSSGFRIESDHVAVCVFGCLDIVQPVCHTREDLPGLSALRIEFQGHLYSR